MRCAAQNAVWVLAMALAMSVTRHAQAQQPPLPLADMQRLAAAHSLLRDSFARPVSGEALMAAALRGMLQETDPEGGEYLSEDDLRGGQSAAKAHVDAQLLQRDGAWLLLPGWGGPADQARRAGTALVLQVPAFHEQTLDEVAELLEREWRQTPFDGLALDLRRCQGGLLSSTIGMAALWVGWSQRRNWTRLWRHWAMTHAAERRRPWRIPVSGTGRWPERRPRAWYLP